MKKIALMLMMSLLMVGVLGGCGKKRVKLNHSVSENIAVLTLDGNLPDQTDDQIAELDRVLAWMDRDIITNLKRSGFNAVLIKNKKEYAAKMGNLLVIDVEDFNAGNRALRGFVGFGAGSSSLDLDYTLLNAKDDKLLTWKDGVGSTKGGTYCAQTLNVNTQDKLVDYYSK